MTLANKIISFNQKFIDNVLGAHSKNNLKTVIIARVNDSTASYWNGFRTQNTSIILHNEKNDHLKIAWTISHECMNGLFGKGDVLSVNFGPNTEYNHFWFDEGFTDYYAHLLNYRNVVISKQEYIENINKSLERHYRHYRRIQEMVSGSYISRTPLAQNVLSDDKFFRNFYEAGRLIAIDLDYIIRSRSGGKFNMDDLLKNLVHTHCSCAHCNIEKQQFYDELTKLIDIKQEWKRSGLHNYMDRYIVDFVPTLPPSGLLEPGATLAYRRSNALDYLGFDTDKSFCTGIISGVEESSNAYKAGLRNGMRVVYMKISTIESDVIDWDFEIEIENPDLSKSYIKYSALGEVMLPYYKR